LWRLDGLDDIRDAEAERALSGFDDERAPDVYFS